MLRFTKNGTPYMKLGEYSLTFSNTKGFKDKWKLLIIARGNEKDVIPLTFNSSLKRGIMKTKMRNRMKSAFEKYIKDGYVYKDDLENIHRDLSSMLGESVNRRIGELLDNVL